MDSDEGKTKFVKSAVTLAAVSSGLTGIYTLTKHVRLHGVHWRAAWYKGCSTCRRKLANKCPFHPSSPPKAYYRMRVSINQDDVQL